MVGLEEARKAFCENPTVTQLVGSVKCLIVFCVIETSRLVW